MGEYSIYVIRRYDCVHAGSNIAHEALMREPLYYVYGLILHVAYSSVHQHQSRHRLNFKIDKFSLFYSIAFCYFVGAVTLLQNSIFMYNFYQFFNYTNKYV